MRHNKVRSRFESNIAKSLLSSATMEHPVFPQELFDIIVDELAHDLKTLRSCALVCRSFCTRARVSSHIRVGRLDGKEHNLVKLLRSSSSFAARVASVHLVDEGGHWMFDPTLEQWGIFDTLASQILPLLVSLQRIRVTDATWHNTMFRNAISLALARPTLTSLEFTGRISKMPFTLFSHCPSLRSLTLTGVSFENCDTFDAAGAACAKLENLCLLELDGYALAQIAYWISLPEFPLDLSCLRSLECTSRRHRLIERLLTASAQSLQRLHLTNYERYFTEWAGDDTLDLRAFAHLHTLSLDFWLNSTMGQSHNQRILSLDNVLFPPVPQQNLALALELCTSDQRSVVVWQLSSADRALAGLSLITSVTVILRLQIDPPRKATNGNKSSTCPTSLLMRCHCCRRGSEEGAGYAYLGQ
ncbi:hypothetical protein B0H12DRAFT_477108 [Mycena haematopus]|nr:hypothetical protein B0H12DRAFT_477108 [Mycena haematopus]